MALQRGARLGLRFPQRRKRRGAFGRAGGRGCGRGLGRTARPPAARHAARPAPRRARIRPGRAGSRTAPPRPRGYAPERLRYRLACRACRFSAASCASSWPRRSSARSRLASAASQLELGLVPAGVEAGDACRFLQDHAPALRPRIDDRADPALADHRRGMRPARQIGEQGLHVAGAHLAAVHAIDAALAAFDPAADLEFGVLVEGRRRGARRLLERKRDLGDIARGPGGGAREDHVVHLAAAQRFRAVLAHRPAQRLDHVRLAASVRPDDPGQARADLHVRGLGEALEPGDAEAGEADGQSASFWRFVRPRRW